MEGIFIGFDLTRSEQIGNKPSPRRDTMKTPARQVLRDLSKLPSWFGRCHRSSLWSQHAMFVYFGRAAGPEWDFSNRAWTENRVPREDRSIAMGRSVCGVIECGLRSNPLKFVQTSLCYQINWPRNECDDDDGAWLLTKKAITNGNSSIDRCFWVGLGVK